MLRAFGARRMRAHIIGVSVRNDGRYTTAMVRQRKFAEHAPHDAVMKKHGMNTAISEAVSEMMVKPISPPPSARPSSEGQLPRCDARCSSIITIASSTTKTVPIVSAITRDLSRLKLQTTYAEGGNQRKRQCHAAINRGCLRAQEQKKPRE